MANDKPISPTTYLWAHQLKRENAHLLKRMHDLESREATHESRLSTLSNDITGSIPALTAQAETMSTAIATLQHTTTTTLPAQLDELTTQSRKRIDSLQSSHDTLSTRIQDLESAETVREEDRLRALEIEKALLKRFDELERNLTEFVRVSAEKGEGLDERAVEALWRRVGEVKGAVQECGVRVEGVEEDLRVVGEAVDVLRRAVEGGGRGDGASGSGQAGAGAEQVEGTKRGRGRPKGKLTPIHRVGRPAKAVLPGKMAGMEDETPPFTGRRRGSRKAPPPESVEVEGVQRPVRRAGKGWVEVLDDGEGQASLKGLPVTPLPGAQRTRGRPHEDGPLQDSNGKDADDMGRVTRAKRRISSPVGIGPPRRKARRTLEPVVPNDQPQKHTAPVLVPQSSPQSDDLDDRRAMPKANTRPPLDTQQDDITDHDLPHAGQSRASVVLISGTDDAEDRRVSNQPQSDGSFEEQVRRIREEEEQRIGGKLPW